MTKPSGAGAGESGAPFALPDDLDSLTLDQLAEHRTAGQAAFEAIYNKEGGPTAADLEPATAIAQALQKLGERESAIKTEAAETAAKFDELRTLATPPAVEGEAPVEVVEGEIVETPADATPNPALVSASGRPTGGAVTASRELGGLSGPKARLNPTLSGARTVAPKPQVSNDLAITASVGLPGKFEAGAPIPNREALGDLIESRAKRMPVTRSERERGQRHHDDQFGGVQVASVANTFDSVFGDDTKADVVQAWIEGIEGKRTAGEFAALVAAGGWCAPSENRYDFFNVACEGGMVDLPTFGVTRGGINFPVSPSVADVFTTPSALAPFTVAMSNATVPWLWTETDDIATVTGAPNKPCMRIPCSTMSNVRLECYGICLTAGNLADNAWPESTRNFLKLLYAAHYHASNARFISSMISLAAPQVTGMGAAGAGTAAPLLGGAELQAWDYRTKYGMCADDVLEYVLPAWSVGAVRSDLAKRTGVSDFMAVTDSQIGAWFSERNIRVQFVQDYQVRSAGFPGATGGVTAWPTTVDGLMYAAGTVVKGNGMTLDLGIVRDSVLNAENDFTAAWMEECHLIARFGHEIRNIRNFICTDGTTGAADLTTCAP